MILCLPVLSYAQITGAVFGQQTEKPLAGASVILLKGSKTPTRKTFCDGDGHFMFVLPPPGKYGLQVSFIGYTTVMVSIEILPQTRKLDLDTMILHTAAISLSRVEVKTARTLISMRKDTMEFSAKDFPTAENASLQNLLEKLPGFYIDPNGDVFFDGKPMKEIYIDGRKLPLSSLSGMGKSSAIQELLAGIADKIQVIDRKNNGLMGTPAGADRIVNITIRKEMKKGINGTIGGGLGNHDRFNFSGNGNMFRDDKQIMLSAGGNNVNSMRGPSSSDEGEYINDRIGGIMRAVHLNSSLSFDLSKKVKVSANVFHQDVNLDNNQLTRRDYILPDSIFHYQARNFKTNQVKGDNFFSNVVLNPVEGFRIDLGLNGFIMSNNSQSSGTYRTSHDKDILNHGGTDNRDQQKMSSLDFTGSLNRLFKDQRSQLNVSWSIGENKGRDQQLNYTANVLPGITADTLNQQVNATTNNTSLRLNVVFTRMLNAIWSLTGGYTFSSHTLLNHQHTLDYDHQKLGYFLPDSSLSYEFSNTNRIHVFNAGLSFRKGKLDGQLSVAFNQNNSYSNLLPSGPSYRQNIFYWAPTLDMNYNISPTKALNLRLSSNPGMIDRSRSMLPVISTANPLYVELGNPDLKPAVDRQLSIAYRMRRTTGFTFSIDLAAVSQQNGISTSVHADSTGRQITMPINVEGNYELRAIVDAGKRFNAQSLTLKYNSFSVLRHTSSIINDEQNKSGNYRSDHRISLSWMFARVAELSLTSNLNYFGNAYSLGQHRYSDFILFKNYIGISLSLPFQINTGTAVIYTSNSSQQQQYTLINAWASKTFLRDHSLLSKVYIYDLLRQNQSLQTVPTPTFIESSQSTVLTQYLMLSVTYFFGKK